MTSDEPPSFCPDHGVPGDVLAAWACPIPDYEQDQGCPYFLAELNRRIEDVKAGNFWRMTKDEKGKRWLDEFRDHQPTGVRKPFDPIKGAPR